MDYAARLTFLQALLYNESVGTDQKKTDLSQASASEAAEYLACYLTFKAIKDAGRYPAEERQYQFDQLSVYQCFALFVHAFLAMPLKQADKSQDFTAAQVVIAKTLFSELSSEELVDVIESGMRKFQLIAEAQHEHWVDFREMLEKVTVSFIIAATDEDSPHDREELLPLFAQLLSQLCEALSE